MKQTRDEVTEGVVGVGGGVAGTVKDGDDEGPHATHSGTAHSAPPPIAECLYEQCS